MTDWGHLSQFRTLVVVDWLWLVEEMLVVARIPVKVSQNGN